MTEKVANNQRDPGLDLLRILSMLLIVLLHSVDHSGVLECAPGVGMAEHFYIRFIYMITQVCVNIYVMLSGYFLVQSKFRIQKIVVLWMEVAFYGFVIKLLFMLTENTPFSWLSLLSCFFPILTGRYWFISIYVGLYVLSPFINTAIIAMDKRKHGLLNIVLLFLFSVLDSIHPSISGMNFGGGWGLPWFVVLYITAAWFRLYYSPREGSVALIFLLPGISLAIAAAYCFLGTCIPIAKTIAGNWYHYNSFPAFISTLALFTVFLNLRINGRFSKWITFLAPSTLGVYLIHAHADLSPYIWNHLDLPQYMGRASFPAIQLGAVVAIYIGCTTIDIVRRKTIGRLENVEIIKRFCGKAETMLTRQIH